LYKPITDNDVRNAIISEARAKVVASFPVYNIPKVYQDVILEAFDSKEWDIMKMDGCTIVRDYWINKFSPSCTPHDFQFKTGRGGFISNFLMNETNKMYAFPGYISGFRLTMVTIGWWGVYKWFHLIKGNVQPITRKMQLAYDFTKKNGKFKAYKN
tara:strand:- start:18999 stop:19466 length:468 start_codon:yes stop_codon:yes gene_type:complete